MSRTLTSSQAAELIQTSADRILDMIRAGEIRAIDISSPGSRRPTWRIPAEELERWMASRSTQPASPKPQRRRRKDKYVPTYY
jgi:excisionase family DNA binding protein